MNGRKDQKASDDSVGWKCKSILDDILQKALALVVVVSMIGVPILMAVVLLNTLAMIACILEFIAVSATSVI